MGKIVALGMIFWLLIGASALCAQPLMIGYAPKPERGGRPVAGGFESEHRPIPKRQYEIRGAKHPDQLAAFVVRPGGSVEDVTVLPGKTPLVEFETPVQDGPFHGPHRLYVQEQYVEDKTLVVRTAQWITLHHSCRWGHDLKNERRLHQFSPCDRLDLDMIAAPLWDENFHVNLMSGDSLVVGVFFKGRPIQGADIRVTTEKKWQKTDATDSSGKAGFELIRDYYPSAWSVFDRDHPGHLLVSAQYVKDHAGVRQGKAYDRIRYESTLPWRYQPSRKDYQSQAIGLVIGLVVIFFSSLAVYVSRCCFKRSSGARRS